MERTERIEKLEKKSYCCKAPIYIKHISKDDWNSSSPYCSKCGEFPPMSPEDRTRLRKMLDEGTLFK